MPEKRKVFISYHHERDQNWFNFFTSQFSEGYEVFQDQSLDDEVNSDDLAYVNRVIREDYIRGSSVTIVLNGAETWKRRFIDWELLSTLDCKHGLLGISIPNTPPDAHGKFVVPGRLHDNVVSGYAHFCTWPSSAADLKMQIETALAKSRFTVNLNNSRPKMKRNER